MQSSGVMPSSTGYAGGKKTGQKMNNYIIEFGKFDILSEKLLKLVKLLIGNTLVMNQLLIQGF